MTVNGSSDIVDITVALHHQTERAILISDDGIETRAKWIAKAHAEVEMTDKFTKGVRRNGQGANFPMAVVTLPVWLAKREGFV